MSSHEHGHLDDRLPCDVQQNNDGRPQGHVSRINSARFTTVGILKFQTRQRYVHFHDRVAAGMNENRENSSRHLLPTRVTSMTFFFAEGNSEFIFGIYLFIDRKQLLKLNLHIVRQSVVARFIFKHPKIKKLRKNWEW